MTESDLKRTTKSISLYEITIKIIERRNNTVINLTELIVNNMKMANLYQTYIDNLMKTNRMNPEIREYINKIGDLHIQNVKHKKDIEELNILIKKEEALLEKYKIQ